MYPLAVFLVLMSTKANSPTFWSSSFRRSQSAGWLINCRCKIKPKVTSKQCISSPYLMVKTIRVEFQHLLAKPLPKINIEKIN